MTASTTAKVRQSIAFQARHHADATAADLVNFLLESEVKLIEEWTRERLLLLVRQQTRPKSPLPDAGPYQMFLEGFVSLAERLPLPGRGKALSKATIVDLRTSLKLTRQKRLEQAQRTASLIREMAPYAKTRRGLTVERYCELRAAGVPANIPKQVRR